MDRQRQRKLDARKRRMESLTSSSKMNLQDSLKKTAKGKEKKKNGTDN